MEDGRASCERVLFAEKIDVMAMLKKMAAPGSDAKGEWLPKESTCMASLPVGRRLFGVVRLEVFVADSIIMSLYHIQMLCDGRLRVWIRV